MTLSRTGQVLSWVVVVQEITAAPILLSVPSQHTAPRVPVEGEESVDSPAGCSGQAWKQLSQLWGPCLAAGPFFSVGMRCLQESQLGQISRLCSFIQQALVGGSLAQDWTGRKPRGAARICVPCSPEADSPLAEARPAHAAGRAESARPRDRGTVRRGMVTGPPA